MAIKYRPAGYTETIGRLGAKAGQAQAAKEKAERAEAQIFRIEMAERERQARREDAMFALELNEEARRRAQTWELEKIDTRSRNDFALEEFEHQTREQQRIMTEIRKEQEMQLKKQQIISMVGKTGGLNQKEANDALLQLETGVPFYTQGKIAERRIDPVTAYLERLGAKAEGTEPPPAPVQGVSQPAEGPIAGKPIDDLTARSFLAQAGGDKAKARALAAEAGYVF